MIGLWAPGYMSGALYFVELKETLINAPRNVFYVLHGKLCQP